MKNKSILSPILHFTFIAVAAISTSVFAQTPVSKAQTEKVSELKARQPTSFRCRSSESQTRFDIRTGARPSVVARNAEGKIIFQEKRDLIVIPGSRRTENDGAKVIDSVLISSPGDYMGNVKPLFEIEIQSRLSKSGKSLQLAQIDGRVMDGMAPDNERSKDLNEENIHCRALN